MLQVGLKFSFQVLEDYKEGEGLYPAPLSLDKRAGVSAGQKHLPDTHAFVAHEYSPSPFL